MNIGLLNLFLLKIFKMVSIEQALQQKKPFNNTFEKIVVNLLFTNSWLAGKQKLFFNKYNLTRKQYNILRILRGANEPISTAVIRDRMVDKMSDASRIVDRLYKKGLVEKSTCDHDLRKVNVVITDESQNLLKKIDKDLETWVKSFSGLNLEEAEQLSYLLDKMRTR